MESIEKRAKFDKIRYASCWEDADILLDALEGKNFLSIASGGDNSFALLAKNPTLVLAIDISTAQLALVELKKIAFERLSYPELLAFFGVKTCNERLTTYQKIKCGLKNTTQEYWDHHLDTIEKGVIHGGKFESYFKVFRKWILPLVHSKKKVNQLLLKKEQKLREEFYQKTWNTRAWRGLFKLFFSKTVMGKLGRDPEFFAYVKTDVAKNILKRTEHALTKLPTDTNPYLEYILTGNFQKALPFYLREENFETIKGNLDKLVLFKGGLQEALGAYQTTKFDGFNLSDIFEYMSHDQYIEQLDLLVKHSKKCAHIVYWNMLADRGAVETDTLVFQEERGNALHKIDKAFFYKAFIVGEVQ